MKKTSYPGPEPLSAGYERLLVGRSRDIGTVVRVLNSLQTRALILHASSGIGKSSLLQAGVVPGLLNQEKYVCSFSNWADVDQTSAARSALSVLAGAMESAAGSGLYEGSRLDQLSEAAELIRKYAKGQDPDYNYPNGEDPGRDLTKAVRLLKERFGDGLVIVLDQLEELFRLDRPLAQRFVGILGDLLSPKWSKYSAFKVVLSLRSEHIAELSIFERRLPKEIWSRLELRGITDPALIDLIIQPPPPDQPRSVSVDEDPGYWVFSDDVAHHLRRRWMLAAFDQDHPAHVEAIPRDGFGLLHLHAALKVLWDSTDSAEGASVRPEQDPSQLSSGDLRSLLRDSGGQRAALLLSEGDDEASAERTAERDTGGDEGLGGIWRWVFGEVLEEHLELWMREAMRELTGPNGPDIALETRAQAALIAPLLSSGSYKVVRNSDDLAESSGSDVLPDHVKPYFDFCVQFARAKAHAFDTGPDREHEDAVVLAELLGGEAARTALDEFVGVELASDNARASLVALLDAPDRLSSAGRPRREFMTLRETIHELVATHERALGWLQRAAVVRFAPGPSDLWGKPTRYVSIVHDGFGPALLRWGVDATQTIESVTHRLVAVTGERPLFAGGDPEAICGRESEPLVWRDLVWIGCAVTRDLKNVTFENCDLSGTVFLRCTFENVTFHNCRMSGTTFLNCTATGTLRLSATKSVDDDVVAAAAPALGAETEAWVSRVRNERQVSSLIFRGGHIDRLVLEELWGMQLSVTDITCGSWLMDYCKLEQVMLQFNATADEQAVRGEIRDSSLADLTLGNTLLQEKSDRSSVSNAKMEIMLAEEGVRPGIQPGNKIRHLTLAVSDGSDESDEVAFRIGGSPEPIEWGEGRRCEERNQDIKFVSKRALDFESTSQPEHP